MTLQQQVKQLVISHGKKRESLLPILQNLILKSKFLTKEMIQEVALQMDLSAADVYGTATFYSFLDTKTRGKNIMRICKTIACDMKKKKEIVEAIEKRLNLKIGETTHDNHFTLLETNCLGHCHQGPAMLINDDIHTELTPCNVLNIIDQYSKQ